MWSYLKVESIRNSLIWFFFLLRRMDYIVIKLVYRNVFREKIIIFKEFIERLVNKVYEALKAIKSRLTDSFCMIKNKICGVNILWHAFEFLKCIFQYIICNWLQKYMTLNSKYILFNLIVAFALEKNAIICKGG